MREVNSFDDRLPWEDELDTDTGSKEEKEQVLTPTTQPPSVLPSVPIQYSSIELWHAMEAYHNMGLSMMWGYAEDTIVKGKLKKVKSPLASTWSSEPEFTLSLEALSKTMAANPTIKLAPIIICGAASGYLEAIDIDIKGWPDIPTKYFNSIAETYPELWAKLRIHRTRSGGYHLLYRILEMIKEGNQKLAYPAGGKEAGIETRAHGGYIMAPPGTGYTVYRDVPIPSITKEERDQLYALAKLYNERKKTVIVPNQKTYESSYDQNPFQHYNSSPQAEEVLTNNGWVVSSDNSQWIHFTRPGKDSGTSASYNKEKRYFHMFTTSTEFDGGKTYDPAAVLAIIQFGGDYKKTFAYLASQGFGKHKPDYEARVIKKLVQTGRPLPKNFSEEAQEQLKAAVSEWHEKYPHGIFWEYNPAHDSYSISLTKLFIVANNLGIARFKKRLVKITHPYFKHIEEAEAMTMLSKYIQEEEEDFFKINDALLSKWKYNTGFFITRTELNEISKKDLLRSSETINYKSFLNGVLEITKDNIEMCTDVLKYGKLIDKDAVINYNFKKVTEEEYLKSMLVKFLRLAISTDLKYVQIVIGYLCFDFKRRGKGYLIALLEGVERGKGGSSGKGLFFELLGHLINSTDEVELRKWTSLISISGGQIEKGEAEMLQMWNGERVVHFSDVPPDVKFSKLKDVVTDGGSVKKLYKDVEYYSAEDYPILGISSQWGVNLENDPGVKKRVRILTFTDYFNVDWEVRDEFKGSLPDIWSDDDWDGYYNFIAEGIRMYIACGKLVEVKDSELMWEKMFDHSYGMGRCGLRDWIADQVIDNWENLPYVAFKVLQSSYGSFCLENNIKSAMDIPRLHEAFRCWGDRYGYEYKHSLLMKVDGKKARVSTIKKRLMKGEVEGNNDKEDP